AARAVVLGAAGVLLAVRAALAARREVGRRAHVRGELELARPHRDGCGLGPGGERARELLRLGAAEVALLDEEVLDRDGLPAAREVVRDPEALLGVLARDELL